MTLTIVFTTSYFAKIFWLIVLFVVMRTALFSSYQNSGLTLNEQFHSVQQRRLRLDHGEHFISPATLALQNNLMSSLNFNLTLVDRDFNDDDYETLLELDEHSHAISSGASPEQIGRLPTVQLDKNTTKDQEQSCSICLDKFQTGDVMKVMPCLHKFHSKCLDQWLEIKSTCPLCLYDIVGGLRA